jgi:uroporphyrinogen decarboxylase
MTSRDLVNALLRNERNDTVALHDGPWPDTLAAWIQQGYPTRTAHVKTGEKRWCGERCRWIPAEVEGDYPYPVPVWEHFGYDMAGVGGWFDVMPQRGVSELLEESDEWEVRRNGAGAALKYWKNKSGTPEHIDFLMTSREVWERDYRAHVLDLDPERVYVEGPRSDMKDAHAKGKWACYGNMFVWELMRQSMGDVCLYESLLLDPEWIKDYNRVYTDFFKAHYEHLFAQAGLPDGVWVYEDLGYRNGLFASPSVLADLVFPYYAELVEFFHGHGLPVILHTCGSVKEAVPMIVDAGFDALNPMERKADGNDPFAFAEQYGDNLAFVGGFDARIFETNDKPLIRREMEQYINGMRERGARLVFGSDHSLSPRIEYGTYCYAVDVYRELAS